MKERLEREGKLIRRGGTPYFVGFYRGERREFPIIEQDTPILGRVYIGKSPREVLYIGLQSYAINDLMKKVKAWASNRGVIEKSRILPAIFDVVKSSMEPNYEKVEQILHARNLWDDKVISLGDFIRAKVGVCRQYALACGALAEKCKYDPELARLGKQLGGLPSIDRNKFNGDGHAWLRYTSTEGRVAILDAGRDFYGRLDKAAMQRIEAGELWPYNRPGERF